LLTNLLLIRFTIQGPRTEYRNALVKRNINDIKHLAAHNYA